MSARAARSRVLFAVLAAAVALAAGLSVWFAYGGSGAAAQPKEDPVVFLRGIVRSIAANDYERVWPTLHPAQQRVATRDLYVRCELLSPVPGHLDRIRVLRSVDEQIAIAGAGGGLVDSKAVTFELKLSEPATAASVVVTKTVHAVAVRGRWRWILSPSRFASYRSGSCPGTGPAPPATT
jgi:hypothetical protein